MQDALRILRVGVSLGNRLRFANGAQGSVQIPGEARCIRQHAQALGELTLIPTGAAGDLHRAPGIGGGFVQTVQVGMEQRQVRVESRGGGGFGGRRTGRRQQSFQAVGQLARERQSVCEMIFRLRQDHGVAGDLGRTQQSVAPLGEFPRGQDRVH